MPRVVSRDTLVTGRKFDYVRQHLASVDGSSLSVDFIDHPGSAAILPVLDDGRHVVLIRNFRHTLGIPIWEIPAGTAHRDEPLHLTALRELKEETGYAAARCVPMLHLYPAPGLTNERMTVFLADGLVPDQACREADEEMTVHSLSLEQALAMTQDGTIQDAKTMISLWHYVYIRPNRTVSNANVGKPRGE